MLFLKDLNVFHIDGKEIPCIAVSGAPDSRFPGAPGCLCMDSGTGNLYLCTHADVPGGTYSWRAIGSVDAAAVQQAVWDYLAQNPPSGGLSADAAALLITILQNAVFTGNQTGNIAALAEALAAGGGSGEDDSGEEAATDEVTVADGVMTIITVGSEIAVSDGVMTIA